MICNVLVELAHVFIDKTFTYNVPSSLKEEIEVGKRVVVPFGNQVLEGFILSVGYESNDEYKDIIEVVDEYPVLNDELLLLGKYMQKMTLSTLMTSYQAMLPLALKS